LAGDTLPTDDPERMGALLAELEPRMNAVALRYTRDPEVAGDVVQNACEKVLRHGSKFRGQSLVSTWIHRIVANEALMWLRSEGRRRTLHEDEPDAAVKSRAFRARRHLEEAVKHSAFI
jgi:RNA polymerase sigma-70 factor (ECF subfamily)